MCAQPRNIDHLERQLTLRQADKARSDFADILDELDFIKSQLARLPTRAEVGWIALRATPLIAALIAVAAVIIMGTVGTNLSSTFNTISTSL
jgi:hypothetical protein